jgi:hypothetical protein
MELMNKIFRKISNRDAYIEDTDMIIRGPEEEKQGLNRNILGGKSPRDSIEDINNFLEEDNIT